MTEVSGQALRAAGGGGGELQSSGPKPVHATNQCHVLRQSIWLLERLGYG